MKFGPFEVDAPLGQGGMGTVFICRGPDGARVAVKIASGHRAADRAAIRREADILEAIDHPGVVRLLDSDMYADTPWLAMEYVVGGALSEVLARTTQKSVATSSLTAARTLILTHLADGGPFGDFGLDQTLDQPLAATVNTAPPDQHLLSIMSAACRALAAVHDAGVVHADVKPENIIVSEARATLVDFGIARWSATGGQSERLVFAPANGGTPWYMSPEQVRGERLDPRADLYAVGCILFEVLHGSPPFDGRDAVDIMLKHAGQPVPEVVAPEPLRTLVAGLLSKERARRPSSAAEVADVLDRFLGRESASGRFSLPLFRPEFQPPPGMERLIRALDAVRKTDGTTVVVVGPPGSGRSRVALEVHDRANALNLDAYLADLQATHGDVAGYGAFRGIIAAIRDRCLERGAEFTAHALGADAAVLAAVTPELRSAPGYPAGAELAGTPSRLDAGRAMMNVIVRTAAGRPVVVVMDNADERVADLLVRFAVAERPPMRVLLVATTSYSDGWWRALPEDAVIELAALDRAQLTNLIRTATPTELEANAVERVARESAGNPGRAMGSLARHFFGATKRL